MDLSRRFFGKAYTVNRFTYDATNSFTLKRAVGYSAGMINYFFRGDIDLVESVNTPGSYAIRNNGKEQIKGRFGLYYDDAADGRIQHKSWNLTIPPEQQVDVGLIERPTSPPPKQANQMMLVFNGDMGDETTAMFGINAIGAVAAAAVALNSSNALYLTGITATSELVHMRVDRNGTKVIPAAEFHPLRSVFAGNPNASSKAYLTKQVEFFNEGREYRTRALIVGRPQFPMVSQGYVFHADVTNPKNFTDYYSCPGQLCWQADVVSPLGKDRVFFNLIVVSSDGRVAGINYFRYRIINGVPIADQSRPVALPPLPTGVTGLAYDAAGRGKLLVSPDGRTIVGFSGNDASRNTIHYELRITINDTVTAEWVQTITDLYVDTPLTPTTITPVAVRKVVFPDECLGSAVTSVDKTLNKISRDSVTRQVNTTSTFFDYQNGSLLRHRSESTSKGVRQADYVALDGTISGGAAFLRGGSCVSEFWALQYVNGTALEYGEGGLLTEIWTGSSTSAQASTFGRFREIFSSPPGYGERAPTNFTVSYDYFGKLSDLNTPWMDYGPPPVPLSGSIISRAFTANMNDAIVREINGASTTIKIGGQVLRNDQNHVGDASPLGELFFASGDLGVVIHEPRPNGIKKWVKPPNVVRLLGAVWM